MPGGLSMMSPGRWVWTGRRSGATSSRRSRRGSCPAGNILAAGLEDVEHDRPTGDAGAPAFLHGPDQLFADIITLPTTDTTSAAATTTDTTSQAVSDRRHDAGDGEPEGAAS
jgi:hypothetical protein